MNLFSRKILLVEDSHKDATFTVNALAEKNLAGEVIVTEDGEDALDFLYKRGKYSTSEDGNPAIIILDIKLPEMSGIEVLKKIRSEPRFKLIPVIMLTSSCDEKDILESYRLGANSFVVKPVDILKFMETIKVLGAYWSNVNQPPPERF